ncbi:7tm 7 domain containing protein [Asbolus verrucosus]|uniref:Gustatory receptor n=1 Tax=Asbolus verrucosus TaxID=1661398 RepID=A0A482VPI7_ASBVE|nr:7tm 7 domain containing protein [Asbolus verrucosus]
MTQHVEEFLKPCTYLFKIFGIYSLDINHASRRNTVGVIWSLSILLYSITHSIYGIYGRKVHFKSLLLTITDTMQLYIALVNAAVSTLFLLLMRRKLSFFLQKLSNFDRSFAALDAVANVQKTYKPHVTSLTLMMIVTICCYTWLDVILYVKEFSFVFIGDVMAYCFPFIIALLIIVQFCLMTLLLKRRFFWINRKLVQIEKHLNKKSLVIDPLESKKIIKILEILRHKHDRLCRLSVTLNKVYSLPLLMTTLQNFIIIIVTLFLHVEDSKPLKKDHSRVLYIIFDSMIIIYSCAEIVMMVKACSTTRSEAKLTATILHRFQKTSQDMDHFVEFFSMQLMHSGVEFSACKIFVIDESLLFSMVGAISTYLIIVLQLQLGD